MQGPGQDGEFQPLLNGVRQWVKVVGAAHQTHRTVPPVPLVLLHGGPGGNHYSFERTTGPLLESQRTVVYHEQRGCGRSDSPPTLPTPPTPNQYSIPLLVADLRALQDWLGAPSVDVLGYSFGGGLALEYAAAHPGRVRRLVLQAPALRFHDPQIVQSQLAGFAQVTQTAQGASGDIADKVTRLLGDHTLSPEAKLDAIWEVVDSDTVDRFLFQNPQKAAQNRRLWRENPAQNTGDMARALNALPPTGTAERLHTLHHPALILAGRHDRNVPLAALRNMARTLPDARLKVFEHSAHFPDMEEPQAYVAAVLEFLA